MSEERANFSFGVNFQNSVLSLMLEDLDFADKALKYVPEDRLYSDAHKFLFTEIKKKWDKAGTVPSLIELEDKLKYIERHKRRMYKAFIEKIYETKIGDIDFIKDKLTEYARKSVFIKIFQDGQVLWNSKRHDDAYAYVLEGINDLYGISFNDDIALDIADFEDVRQRYLQKSLTHNNRIPTNIEQLDETLNGGLEKGELGVLLGEAKSGKSAGLVHMGCAALLNQGGRVAHFCFF